MKRFFAAVVIFTFLLGICFAEYFVTDKFEKEIENHIRIISDYRNKKKNALVISEINKLKKYFEKNETCMDIFCHEDIMDDIERSIYRLNTFVLTDDDALFYSELEVLRCELKELKRTTGLTLRGVV